VVASNDEVIASKVEIIASKVEVIACNEALLSRTAEELQQYKGSASASKPAAAAATDEKHDAEQPCSKRQRVHNSSSSSSFEIASPLDRDEILDHIFGYVGGGDHLYVGGVNRHWRGRYMQYCAQNSRSAYAKKFCTRHRSVLMSASRLQLAIKGGLAVARWTFRKWSRAELVCKHSLEPQQVMTILRVHGVHWCTSLSAAAAFDSKLSLLQWLHSISCPWQHDKVLRSASRGGSVAMLECLLTMTAPWSADLKTEMLERAGWSDRTTV
jgi:hypothetical protein